ncbi:MAG: N-acetylmuramoyl-L-alanine amidase [Thermoanaerobaculia bacterium]
MSPGACGRPAIVLALAVALASGVGAAVRVPVADGVTASIAADEEIVLEAQPQRGDGWLVFSRRFSGTTETIPALIQANGGRKQLLTGLRYRVPFAVLTPEWQSRVLRALFPQDQAVSGGWQHRVGDHAERESLWGIASWFTGRGDAYKAIRAANGMVDDHLEAGDLVLVPAGLLLPALRSSLPPGSPWRLQYDRDALGDYASYRLQPGEALYSSVVIRFTGRVFAEDVNELADVVARRSGIREVTDIPIGYEVKIPLDLLLPEFLPSGHPTRVAWEQGLIASSQYSNPVRATRLQDVTVVLDAGHGGRDVGASVNGIWESVYVFDIVARIKETLERTTAATVLTTTADEGGVSVVPRDQLPYSKGHRVLTEPPYPIEDSRVGVNLRWYLANSLLRRVSKDGGSADNVVFLSLHADSLHPSLRGAMAYIPGAQYRGGTHSQSGAVYAARREFKEQPRVSFSGRELARSEGLSRDLAGHLVDAFLADGLPVHEDRPVREKIVRSGRPWVPAVLRYNEIPAGVLLEVCNLVNPEDRKLLLTQRYRQQVAEAVVQGILSYYGVDRDEAPRLASTAG